jgi:UDPglucose 6-dehydrogenase
MKIAVIGTGYVGLVSGVCFAEAGNDVIAVDVNQEKLAKLRAGVVPIYEPGLEHLFHRNTKEDRLQFTDDLAHAVASSEIIFLALPTPPGEGGAADLKYVLGASEDIGKLLTEGSSYKIVVTKSTVPVGTADKVRAALEKNAQSEFDVVSNPEFLREGVAVEDFMKPERVVIGVQSDSKDPHRAEALMHELYRPFLLSGNPMLVMDARSAEITKYAANAMLALRISFMNDIANLCERCGSDVDKVRLGIGIDSRIGRRFLFAGTGYGGSCFPKDVQALIVTGAEYGAPQSILEATEAVNYRQKTTLIPRIESHFGADLTGKKFALWGLAFKPNTDDIREAPALVILDELISRGASVVAYDPEAAEAVQKQVGDKYGDSLTFSSRHYEACDGADALVIATEWPKFREPDFHYLKELLKNNVIFDGRNVYELETMRREGFTYHSIGRPVVNG